MPDKSRYVYLYLPSAEEKARWDDLAKKAGMPLTKFVIEIVQNALADDEEFKPRGELTTEIAALKKDVKELKDELKLKTIVLEKYEAELKRYRSAAFLDDSFEGVRSHNRELVDLLKRGGTLDSYKILESLGINPKDSDLVKAISLQLEEMEAYGIIKSTLRGWKWVA
jgi:predicted DNA-binding protein